MKSSQSAKQVVIGMHLAWFGKTKIPFLKRVAFFMATGAGVGLIPWAPGTMGSLLGVVVFYFGISVLNWQWQVCAVLFMTLVGLWSSRVVARHTGIHDDQRIVIDEVVGMWITLCGNPVSIPLIFIGFIGFRLLDILKPFPADFVDRTFLDEKGVMFDDIVSGIYGHALLYTFIRISVFL